MAIHSQNSIKKADNGEIDTSNEGKSAFDYSWNQSFMPSRSDGLVIKELLRQISDKLPSLATGVGSVAAYLESSQLIGLDFLRATLPELSTDKSLFIIREVLDNALNDGLPPTFVTTIFRTSDHSISPEERELYSKIFEDQALSKKYFDALSTDPKVAAYLRLLKEDDTHIFFSRPQYVGYLSEHITLARFDRVSGLPDYTEFLKYLAHSAILKCDNKLSAFLVRLDSFQDLASGGSNFRKELLSTAAKKTRSILCVELDANPDIQLKASNENISLLLDNDWKNREEPLSAYVSLVNELVPSKIHLSRFNQEHISNEIIKFRLILENTPLVALRAAIVDFCLANSFKNYLGELSAYYQRQCEKSLLPKFMAVQVMPVISGIFADCNACVEILNSAGASIPRLKFSEIKESQEADPKKNIFHAVSYFLGNIIADSTKTLFEKVLGSQNAKLINSPSSMVDLFYGPEFEVRDLKEFIARLDPIIDKILEEADSEHALWISYWVKYAMVRSYLTLHLTFKSISSYPENVASELRKVGQNLNRLQIKMKNLDEIFDVAEKPVS